MLKSEIRKRKTHFHKRDERSVALWVVHDDAPIAIPFVEYSIHHRVSWYNKKKSVQYKSFLAIEFIWFNFVNLLTSNE